jgi:hypothetical protein
MKGQLKEEFMALQEQQQPLQEQVVREAWCRKGSPTG